MNQSQIKIQIRNCPNVDITIDFIDGIPMPVTVQQVTVSQEKEAEALTKEEKLSSIRKQDHQEYREECTPQPSN